MLGQDLLQELRHGGYTLLVIGICSLMAAAIAVERLIAMGSVLGQARALAEGVSKSLLRGDHGQGRALCERSRSLAADIFLAGFARYGQGARESFEAAVERERVALLLKLKSNLWALGTVGTVSPFVGLFGTVVGIRSAFTAMAAAGTGGFSVVANGISEALVSTAAGIFVAIEAVVLYNYFQARLGRLSAELKLISDEFVELLRERPPTVQAVPAAPPDASSAPVADARAGSETR
jgi:biopolymer transport protein ExbB